MYLGKSLKVGDHKPQKRYFKLIYILLNSMMGVNQLFQKCKAVEALSLCFASFIFFSNSCSWISLVKVHTLIFGPEIQQD